MGVGFKSGIDLADPGRDPYSLVTSSVCYPNDSMIMLASVLKYIPGPVEFLHKSIVLIILWNDLCCVFDED